MTQLKKKKKIVSRPLAGYRLHDKRISQTARSGAIRTIKYELKSPNTSATRRLAECILHDYVHIYGPMDLFSIQRFGNDIPNLVDIWFSFLQRGGVFQSREEDLYSLGEIKCGTSGATAFLKEILGEELLSKTSYVEDQLAGFLKTIRGRAGQLGKERAAKKLTRAFPTIEEYCIESNKDFSELCSFVDPSGPSRGNVEEWFPSFSEFLTGERHELPVRGENAHSEDKELKSLTAAIIPELEVRSTGSKHDDMEAIIIRRKDWLEKHGVDPKDAAIDDLLGINSGTNALSHFFSRFLTLLEPSSEGVARIVTAMDRRMHYDDAERAYVEIQLYELAEVTQLLPLPKAISGKWGDYRADFNGTISSWIANNVRRSGEIRELIPDTIKAVEEVVKDINSFRNSSLVESHELTKKEEYVIDQCELLQNILEEMRKGSYAKFFPQYRDYVALIRDELNQWGQNSLGRLTWKELKSAKLERLSMGKPKKGDDSEQQWHINKAYPQICKDLPDIPVFFGENKLAKIQKHKDSLKLIKSGFVYTSRLLQLLMQEENPNVLDSSDVEKLRKCYAKCTTIRKQEVEQLLIKHSVEIDSATLAHRNARFHVTGYERNKTLRILELKSVPTLDEVSDLLIDLVGFSESVHQEGKDWDLFVDTLELAKTILAIHLKHAKRCKPYSALTAEMGKYFPVYQAFIADVDQDDTAPVHVNRQLQRFVFSEMRGAIQQAAKTKAICRSIIQSINGDQGAVLVTRKESDPKSIAGGLMLEDVRSRRFYYSMDIEGEMETPAITQNFYRIEKSKANATDEDALQLMEYKLKPSNELFEICSSKHQIQFLRWLCEKPKKKINRLALQGGFTLAEIEFEMSWNSDLELELKVSDENEESHRTFVALPFSIVSKTGNEATIFNNNRLVGVDVGEYGLAVTVINVHENGVTVLDQIFLNDPQYRALQKEVDMHRKDRQVRATANQVTTRIARLRETVIGSYRNQLHQLSLKYQGRLVFENEISAFETAGQQIKKIYASIKQADVYSQIDAHKMTLNHAWGKWKKDGFQSGVEIGAAGTSRLCTSCNRWADILIEQTQKYVVQKVEGYGGRLGQVVVDGHTLMVAELKEGVTSLTGKDLGKHIYKFMRPPMVDPTKPSNAVQYRIQKQHQNGLAAEVAEMTNRGNQALYLCPFEDCCHYADADLQASFTIALKRYLRERSEADFYDRKDWVNDLQAFAKENDLPKIGINPQKNS